MSLSPNTHSKPKTQICIEAQPRTTQGTETSSVDWRLSSTQLAMIIWQCCLVGIWWPFCIMFLAPNDPYRPTCPITLGPATSGMSLTVTNARKNKAAYCLAYRWRSTRLRAPHLWLLISTTYLHPLLSRTHEVQPCGLSRQRGNSFDVGWPTESCFFVLGHRPLGRRLLSRLIYAARVTLRCLAASFSIWIGCHIAAVRFTVLD